jgi:hypothetical protein
LQPSEVGASGAGEVVVEMTKAKKPRGGEPSAEGTVHRGGDEGREVAPSEAAGPLGSDVDAERGDGAGASTEEAGTVRSGDAHPEPGSGVSGLRNLSQRSARKGGDDLELSRSGKASRKSTRKSKGRVKRTTNLQLRAERATGSPKARAARPSG